MHRQAAAQFIAEQQVKMAEHNVTGMTRRQRARIEALDVVSPEEREFVLDVARQMHTMGPAPHGDTGTMRVLNFRTGEMSIRIAPRRKLDIELDEAIEALV